MAEIDRSPLPPADSENAPTVRSGDGTYDAIRNAMRDIVVGNKSYWPDGGHYPAKIIAKNAEAFAKAVNVR